MVWMCFSKISISSIFVVVHPNSPLGTPHWMRVIVKRMGRKAKMCLEKIRMRALGIEFCLILVSFSTEFRNCMVGNRNSVYNFSTIRDVLFLRLDPRGLVRLLLLSLFVSKFFGNFCRQNEKPTDPT